MSEIVQKLEAILFTSGSPVQKKQMAKMIGCDGKQLEDAISTLMERRTTDGVVVVDDGTHITLATNPSISDFVETIQEENQSAPLSRATQETLSIIAYAGPITKTDLDFLRGVNTRYTLRRLTMRGLIRNEQKNKSTAVAITTDFLFHLGIQKPEELPEYTQVRKTILDNLQKVKQKTTEKEL